MLTSNQDQIAECLQQIILTQLDFRIKIFDFFVLSSYT